MSSNPTIQDLFRGLLQMTNQMEFRWDPSPHIIVKPFPSHHMKVPFPAYLPHARKQLSFTDLSIKNLSSILFMLSTPIHYIDKFDPLCCPCFAIHVYITSYICVFIFLSFNSFLSVYFLLFCCYYSFSF